jgi:hypothetical protein
MGALAGTADRELTGIVESAAKGDVDAFERIVAAYTTTSAVSART